MKGNPPSSRLPGLDGLRGISILLVLMLHSLWYKHLHLSDQTAETLNQVTFPLGTFGVPIFFVISGFLITYLLLREEAKNGKISLKAFWARRVFRIVPPVLAYMVIVGCYSYYTGADMKMSDAIPVLLFFRNVAGGSQITDHFWSLSLEEQFYLIWPLVIFFTPSRLRLKLAFTLLLVFPSIRIVSVLCLSPTMHALVMNLVRFDFIMGGCLLALLWQASGFASPSRVAGDRLFIWGSILVLMAWWLAYESRLFPCFGNMKMLADVLQQEAINILLGTGVCAITIVLVTNSSIFCNVVNLSILTGIGVISYSLYLWQQFFFFDPKLPHFMMYLPVRFAFCAGACGYYFVEKPSNAIRRRIGDSFVSKRLAAESSARRIGQI